jgi:SAM-dependent methyltransferase
MDYSRYYQRYHDSSEKHFAEAACSSYQELKPFVNGSSGKVLDVGCGMGFALEGLRRAGFSDLRGFDSDAAQVKSATARGLNVDLVQPEDSLSYIESHSPFDLILSIDVLEHIPTPALMPLLMTISRSLKPNGKFICRVPNCDSVVATRYRYNDWTHCTQFGDASLDFVLFNAGFKNIQVLGCPDSFPISKAVVRWLLRRAMRGLRRAELLSELSWREAMQIPLSPNIWGVASS